MVESIDPQHQSETKQQPPSSSAIPSGWRSRSAGKAIWGLVAAVDLFVRGFGLSLYFLPRRNRQVYTWTWRQALATEMARVAFSHMTYTKFVWPVSMESGAEGDRFIVISPPPNGDMSYTGIFHSDTIRPSTIGATWYPTLPSHEALVKDRIVLHFHGGSFIWASGRDEDSKFTGNILARHLGGYALLIQYRLALEEIDSFPAAFQDALTSYLYLINSGVKAENIILSGDSAGALLAIGLLRYLSSSTAGLPLPRACLLFSPSLDLVVQGDKNIIDNHRNQKTDYCGGSTLAWGVSAFLPGEQPRDTPYLSPARHPFGTNTPIWIQTGTNEVLVDTYKMFVKAMQEIQGNRIEHYEVLYAPHNILFVGHILGWQEAVESALLAAKAFVE